MPSYTKIYKEEELLEGCLRQLPAFQQALYQQYHRKMYGVCLRYADNKDDASDILQDGFVQVFRHIHTFRSGGSLEGWVRRIMVNMSIAHYRKRSRYFMTDIEEANGLKLDEEVLSDMTAAEIMEVIQELPVGYRTIFNMYEIEGYTHPEIGEILNISVGTSKSQLSRAKELLRTKLKNRIPSSDKVYLKDR